MGSEMCIRDSTRPDPDAGADAAALRQVLRRRDLLDGAPRRDVGYVPERPSGRRCENQSRAAPSTPVCATARHRLICTQAVDIDKDGHMDLLVAKTEDNNTAATDAVAWYKNDGATTPSFGAAHVVDASLTGFSSSWATRPAYATDLDADGDIDILVADAESGSTGGVIYWYENDGAQTFGTTSRREVHRPDTNERGVYALDLDGDGDVDVLAASFSSTLYWLSLIHI